MKPRQHLPYQRQNVHGLKVNTKRLACVYYKSNFLRARFTHDRGLPVDGWVEHWLIRDSVVARFG